MFPALAPAAEPTATERALRLSDEGVELYKAHDYRRAIEKYASAYELDPDPNLLFNQGKCYEALGDYPAANDKYREFLSKPNGDVNARKKANDFVAKFNAGGVGPAAPGAPAPAPASTGAEAPGDRSGAGPWRAVGFGLLGVGVAGAAVGGYFFLSGGSDVNEVKDLPNYGLGGDPAAVAPLGEAAAQKKIDDGESKQRTGAVLMGAGAGVAVAGLTMVLLAPKSARASAAAVGAAPLPGGGFFTLRGSF